MEWMFVSLTTIYQISYLCHLLLYRSWDWLSQQHKKCWNKLYTSSSHLTLKCQWKPNFFMLAAFRSALAIMLAMTTKVTQISLVCIALGKAGKHHQLVGNHCSVRFQKHTSMAENSFDWCWYARCTQMLSKSGLKHANSLLSLTKCQGIPASVPSSISWMNARYEATTVGREMWITYSVLCIIIHQGLENIETFVRTKTKTKTFISRPRPRPLFLHVFEAPRDQDQGLETASLAIVKCQLDITDAAVYERMLNWKGCP